MVEGAGSCKGADQEKVAKGLVMRGSSLTRCKEASPSASLLARRQGAAVCASTRLSCQPQEDLKPVGDMYWFCLQESEKCRQVSGDCSVNSPASPRKDTDRG